MYVCIYNICPGVLRACRRSSSNPPIPVYLHPTNIKYIMYLHTLLASLPPTYLQTPTYGTGKFREIPHCMYLWRHHCWVRVLDSKSNVAVSWEKRFDQLVTDLNLGRRTLDIKSMENISPAAPAEFRGTWMLFYYYCYHVRKTMLGV